MRKLLYLADVEAAPRVIHVLLSNCLEQAAQEHLSLVNRQMSANCPKRRKIGSHPMEEKKRGLLVEFSTWN